MCRVAAVVLVLVVAGVAALEELQCGEVARESCPQLQTYIVGRWHVSRVPCHVSVSALHLPQHVSCFLRCH